MKKYLKIVFCLLLLTSTAFAVKTQVVIKTFNAGELSELMDSRSDQAKYVAGCRTLENFIPLIYGGAQRRPGTEYIATQKSSSAKGRLVAFEHSVDDTYILLFENQVIRAFKDSAQVTTGAGTETDATYAAAGTVLSHWKMNDNTSNTVVTDTAAAHNFVSSTNTSIIHTEGKVGTGSFNLDGQYALARSADHSDFSFIEGTNGDFSITGWVRVSESGTEQVVMSKWDETIGSQAREWILLLDTSHKLKMVLADESLLFDSDLIAHWKLNDSAQTNAVDDAAGSNDGALADGDNNYTSDHSVAGKVSNAFDLDGTNDTVKIDDAAVFSFGDGATTDSTFSISAWINMDDATDFPILAKYESGNKEEWVFYVDGSDKLVARCHDFASETYIGRTYNTALTAQQGSYIHVVMTYDATEASSGINLYLDGSDVDNADSENGAYAAMHNTASDVYIGFASSNFDDYANGKIDNVMIFNKELSQAEVTALYNSDSGTEDLGSDYISSITDDALDDGWRFIGMTYEGENGSWTGATAANYIDFYVDEVDVDQTATNLSTYVKMEDTAAIPRIGAQESTTGVIEKIFASKVDNVAIFSTFLSAANVASLFTTGATYEITTPYLTADLFQLKFEQSADVMYITHPDYEPRRLARLADDDWLLDALDLQDGPFRDQNTVISKTIIASATTGSVTLTAVGHAPFVSGTSVGHLPSGSTATSKSQTGALFRLVQAVSGTDASIGETLNSTTLNDVTSTITVPKGVTWDFTTNGTWGTSGPSAIVLERSYDSGTTYETVSPISSLANKNTIDSGTEEFADALYRARVSDGTGTGTAEIQISIRDTSHIGIVEITSVTSPTVAIGTVLTTLASTDKTHRFSEGSFSNLRGWPIDVKISSEERLTFAGNIAEPLTTWGSVVDDWTSFAEGTLDTDAIIFTLIGSGQQNRIRWLVSKDSLFLGTVGGEHLLGASKVDEALTPTNARARLQTTYGSENISALIVNQAILFVQRGGKKIREFLYNFDADAHKADDLTVFSEHITGGGIVDMVYQRTPDPTLWCIRTDGEIAIMTYERDQKVFSWSRIFTNTNLAGTSTKSVIESAAIIFGGTRSEDEVWITVNRQISGSDARYVERFTSRAMPSSVSDMKFLDSYITDTGGDTTIEGLTHLIGQTVQVLGDGLVQATKVVNGSGVITAATTASKYQVGLGYTSTLKPMKLDIADLGLATTKRINKAIVNVFETIGGEVGTSTSDFEDIPTGTGALARNHYQISMPGGYSREGDIIIRQTQPLPMTALSLTLEVGIGSD